MSENRDYTRPSQGTESDCLSMYSVHCRVIVDNKSDFSKNQKIIKKNMQKHLFGEKMAKTHFLKNEYHTKNKKFQQEKL